MWLLKFIIPYNKGLLLGDNARRYRISMQGYPISNYWKKNKFYVLASGLIIGEKKQKKKFLEELRKDKRSVKIDMMNENFGIWLMEQDPSINILYEPSIIHVKPAIVTRDGDYIFEIACWNKDKLMKIAKLIQTELYRGEINHIKKGKIDSIMMVSLGKKLTEKQMRALELAIENGYYGYPRKTELVYLAKMMKISTSTYQFHLRNAERKMMPYLFQNFIS